MTSSSSIPSTYLLTEADEFKLSSSGKREGQIAGLRVTAKKMVATGGYEIESLASRFTSDTEEIDSIKSTADTQTRWILSRPIRADLKKDGIDFAQLKKRPTTVYVVLPAERLRTHSVWLRLVIVSALRALYKPGGPRTLMLIDEMAALGHLAPLEDAFGLVRGYGIQIAAILQDLPQLKGLYKERWETFIANAGAVFGFAPNDLTTADWMSKRSGQTTVVVKGFNQNAATSTHVFTRIIRRMDFMSFGLTAKPIRVGRRRTFAESVVNAAPWSIERKRGTCGAGGRT